MDFYRRAMAKWVAYSVLLLLAILLQVMVFPRLPVPNPICSLAAVIPVAMFAGSAGGAAAGFVCGLLCDAMLPSVEAYFTLALMGAGALTGFLCVRTLQKSFWTAMLLGLLCNITAEFFFVFTFYLITGRAPWISLWQTALPEALAGVLCIPLFYPVIRGISKRFSEE